MTAFNFQQISIANDPQSFQAQIKLDLFQCLSDVSSDWTFLASIVHLMLLRIDEVCYLIHIWYMVTFSFQQICLIRSSSISISNTARPISMSLKSSTRLDFLESIIHLMLPNENRGDVYSTHTCIFFEVSYSFCAMAK